ncbi:MAG: HAMP domain-containing histidine kinase [Clostridiales bacterium]|nr:HAMP domain-containing histidine kinase [Clostridiales bacterium]
MLSREHEAQLKQYCEKDEKTARLIHHMEESYRMNLSRISHEIRNPVTLINSFLQLTAAKHPEVTEFSTWHPIIENMEYLKQLLEELSDYNNSNTLHKERFSLTPFLESLVYDCKPSLLPVQLSFEKTTAIPSAYFDKMRIQSAVLNLIRNASEALAQNPDGKILVSLSFDGTFFYIRVANNGPQIPPEQVATLFDPFITHKKGGTGLGLTIIRNVALAHGGSVSVSSDAAETSFTIKLPISYEK